MRGKTKGGVIAQKGYTASNSVKRLLQTKTLTPKKSLTMNEITFEKALKQMRLEMEKAQDKYGPFASPIEAVGVMQEELDEIWEDIHLNFNRSARDEAIQLAAVCMRFASGSTTREDAGQL